MTAPEADVVRQFLDALPAAARDHLRTTRAYDHIPLIAAACTGHKPADVAKRVAVGVTRTHPANAPALLLWRLRREAGQLDDQHDDPPPTEAHA